MSVTVIRSNMELKVGDYTYEGDLLLDSNGILGFEYSDTGETERFSVSLVDYGYVLTPGCVWIKDWSEHKGLAQALVDAGVAVSVMHAEVGPFHSVAYMLRILLPEEQTVTLEAMAS